MNYSKRVLTRVLLTSMLCSFVISLSAADNKNLSSAAKKSRKYTRAMASSAGKSSSRSSKLLKRHQNEIRLLKEIHEIQKHFLNNFDGRVSKISQAERDNLKLRLEALPSSVKTNDMPYFSQMENIEYTVYAILSGKEKYKNKKAIKNPEKLLEDILLDNHSLCM